MKIAAMSLALGMFAVTPVLAQTQAPAQAQASAQAAPDTAAADRAADVMIQRTYIYDPVTPKTPTQIVQKLQALGYTNIHDFDVEYRTYQVEAISPQGQDVEIEIDPITGAILDIEENFL